MSQTADAIIEHSEYCQADPSADAAIVCAAQQTLDAFEPFYRAYADRVNRYCLR